MPLSKEKMREYQRKRRVEQKMKSLGLGEKEAEIQTKLGDSDVVTSDNDPALPWPINPNKGPRWGEGVAHYIAPTEEEKEAMNRRELEKSRILREERKAR